MDAQARQELLAAIQAFVGRHQAATDGTCLVCGGNLKGGSGGDCPVRLPVP